MELEQNISETIDTWKKKQGWSTTDPFIHNTNPRLFTGFEDILKKLYILIDMGQNYGAIYGDYGYGKTMILKKTVQDLKDKYNVTYFEEPVTREQIAESLISYCKIGLFAKLRGKIPKTNDYTRFNTLIDKRTVLIFDEAHSLSEDTYSYLRNLSENGTIFTIIFAGKPDIVSLESENRMPQYLLDRLKLSQPIRSMNKKEAAELIKKRVKILAGSENHLFTDEAIELITRKSRYTPREILENASNLVQYAIEKDTHQIDEDTIERKFYHLTKKQPETSDTYAIITHEAKAEPINKDTFLKELSPLQSRIIETLFRKGPLSTPKIAEELREENATIRHMMHRLQGKYDEIKTRQRIAHLYPLVRSESVQGVRGNIFTLTTQTKKTLSTD